MLELERSIKITDYRRLMVVNGAITFHSLNAVTIPVGMRVTDGGGHIIGVVTRVLENGQVEMTITPPPTPANVDFTMTYRTLDS